MVKEVKPAGKKLTSKFLPVTSGGNTKPTTVLVRTSCHEECSETKISSPPFSPGSRSSTSGRPLEAHPCHWATSSCILQQWLLSKGFWVQPHGGIALWAWTPKLCCSELQSPLAAPYCHSYRPWTASGRTRNLLIPQASGLNAGGSSWRESTQSLLWPPAWAVQSQLPGTTEKVSVATSCEGRSLLCWAGQGWQEKLPTPLPPVWTHHSCPCRVPNRTFNSSCTRPANNFSFGKAFAKILEKFWVF